MSGNNKCRVWSPFSKKLPNALIFLVTREFLERAFIISLIKNKRCSPSLFVSFLHVFRLTVSHIIIVIFFLLKLV